MAPSKFSKAAMLSLLGSASATNVLANVDVCLPSLALNGDFASGVLSPFLPGEMSAGVALGITPNAADCRTGLFCLVAGLNMGTSNLLDVHAAVAKRGISATVDINTASTYQTFDTTVGHIYSFNGFYRAGNVASQGCAVSFYDGAKQSPLLIATANIGDAKDTTTWVKVTGAFKATQEKTKVLVDTSCPSDVAMKVFLDNFSLVDGTAATGSSLLHVDANVGLFNGNIIGNILGGLLGPGVGMDLGLSVGSLLGPGGLLDLGLDIGHGLGLASGVGNGVDLGIDLGNLCSTPAAAVPASPASPASPAVNITIGMPAAPAAPAAAETTPCSTTTEPAYTMSTMTATSMVTITQCPATVTNCPASEKMTITTMTEVEYTTYCPVEATMAPSGTAPNTLSTVTMSMPYGYKNGTTPAPVAPGASGTGSLSKPSASTSYKPIATGAASATGPAGLTLAAMATLVLGFLL